MHKLPDGTIWLNKGEIILFVCPCCSEPFSYNKFIAMPRCPNCKFSSFHEDFAALAVQQ